MTVKITYDALDDMRDIHSYISEVLQSKETADRQLNRLRKAIKSLDTFPERYKLTV